ncbi:hypothetical protein [Enterobacter mori]
MTIRTFKTIDQQVDELSSDAKKRIHKIACRCANPNNSKHSFALAVLLRLFEQHPECSDEYAEHITKRRLSELVDEDEEQS